MIALDFIVFTVGTYFMGFYVGHKLTKKKYEEMVKLPRAKLEELGSSNPNKHFETKKYERRLSTPRQTVQSGSSTNGEARSETK